MEPSSPPSRRPLVRHERSIDEDHYGAGFAFRFGSADEPLCRKHDEVLAKRLGKDPSRLRAIGGVDEILSLLDDFRAVGVHKFILRPIAASGAEVMSQTEQLIEAVLPEVNRMNEAA